MHNKPQHITPHSSPINNDGAFFMATTPRRTVKTPGATTPESTEQPPVDTTEDTTSTVSEPDAEVVAEQTPPESTEQAEAAPALPDDYEEYLAWKNSRAKQADEPVTPVATTTSMGAVNGVKRKRPVLGPEGWTQEEY